MPSVTAASAGKASSQSEQPGTPSFDRPARMSAQRQGVLQQAGSPATSSSRPQSGWDSIQGFRPSGPQQVNASYMPGAQPMWPPGQLQYVQPQVYMYPGVPGNAPGYFTAQSLPGAQRHVPQMVPQIGMMMPGQQYPASNALFPFTVAPSASPEQWAQARQRPQPAMFPGVRPMGWGGVPFQSSQQTPRWQASPAPVVASRPAHRPAGMPQQQPPPPPPRTASDQQLPQLDRQRSQPAPATTAAPILPASRSTSTSAISRTALQADQKELQDQANLPSSVTAQTVGGKVPCAFFLKTGTCAYGDKCKFEHPWDKLPVVRFNAIGLPLRPGQPECAYYLRHGRCGFGPSCKFHHPEPGTAGVPPTTAEQGTAAAAQTLATSEPPLDPAVAAVNSQAAPQPDQQATEATIASQPSISDAQVQAQAQAQSEYLAAQPQIVAGSSVPAPVYTYTAAPQTQMPLTAVAPTPVPQFPSVAPQLQAASPLLQQQIVQPQPLQSPSVQSFAFAQVPMAPLAAPQPATAAAQATTASISQQLDSTAAGASASTSQAEVSAPLDSTTQAQAQPQEQPATSAQTNVSHQQTQSQAPVAMPESLNSFRPPRRSASAPASDIPTMQTQVAAAAAAASNLYPAGVASMQQAAVATGVPVMPAQVQPAVAQPAMQTAFAQPVVQSAAAQPVMQPAGTQPGMQPAATQTVMQPAVAQPVAQQADVTLQGVLPQAVPTGVPVQQPQLPLQQIAQQVPQLVPQLSPQQVPQEISQQVPQQVPQQAPQQVPQQAPQLEPQQPGAPQPGLSPEQLAAASQMIQVQPVVPVQTVPVQPIPVQPVLSAQPVPVMLSSNTVPQAYQLPATQPHPYQAPAAQGVPRVPTSAGLTPLEQVPKQAGSPPNKGGSQQALQSMSAGLPSLETLSDQEEEEQEQEKGDKAMPLSRFDSSSDSQPASLCTPAPSEASMMTASTISSISTSTTFSTSGRSGQSGVSGEDTAKAIEAVRKTLGTREGEGLTLDELTKRADEKRS